ncbi:MAG: 5-(carboxyamino)imidazole ribonucleotide synthase [Firmicutes bacterium HGW-Firmicutes-1]|jgi:5-(carboxyamino)imidazole ribonucleotide synthase|nr:MAG: 5-(carboxyamino)imidazole ribonucleotide synthase [Firmicutes bacterium HGW-Firmicutes-1]
MNCLKKKIGIIGGGQLGKMMILDAKKLGFYVITLDPTLNCPSHSLSDEHIVAAFDDEEAIKKLAEKSDVITYEFEHISISALEKIEKDGHIVYPTVSSLATIQNKFTQKSLLHEKNIPVPEFEKVNDENDIKIMGSHYSYPIMLKSCTGGYDGKGNVIIQNEAMIAEAYSALGGGAVPLMVEKFVPFMMEISVLACRGIEGDIVIYPVGQNIHRNSILDETIVPASISSECTRKAMELAYDVMEIFHGVGMFCVEMFVTTNEEIFINEVAPRPHNSGHYTIEGCLTSQFEQHIRAITGLPFGDVSLRCPTVMRNLLGEEEAEGSTLVEGLEEVFKLPNVKVHIYGKQEVKPGRKMGHLTVCASTVEKARSEASQAKAIIKIIAEHEGNIND